MRKLELKIEKCGDCPYLVEKQVIAPIDNIFFHCGQLWDGGHQQPVRFNELLDDCPLPVYIEGQKEIF